MEMTGLLAFILLFGGICGVIGLTISLICVACVVGFLRSTHTVQYMPVETPYINEPLVPPQNELDEEEELLKKVGRKPKPPVNLAEKAVEDITQSDNF